MNLPIGKLFYFVPKIGERDANGNHKKPYGIPNGDNDVANGDFDGGRNLYDRFYEEGDGADEGLFDYSKGKYTVQTLAGKKFVTFENGLATDSDTLAAGTYSSVIIKVDGFDKRGSGKISGPNGNEMDTEEFLASLEISHAGINGGIKLPFNVVTQKYGNGIVEYGAKGTGNTGEYPDIVDKDGVIYLQVDMETYTAAAGFAAEVIDNPINATDLAGTYRQYGSLEFEDEIGEVSFDLDSVTVSVTERKLRASWSPELAQAVSAFHNIDAEAELTALLSEQIAAEVDREILRDLRKGAAWNLKWDYNEWKYGGNGNATLQGYTQKDWNQTLITKINQLSAQIHKTTLRGGANWIVVSSEVSAVFDDLEYFHVSNAGAEQDQYNMGIEKVGTLAGRYQVYRDPYFPAGKVLVGHKGKSLLDAGYIYAPYVPLQLTPTMYNPFNFTPIKGIMTRYAKKMVNNRYFGVINVAGLQTFNLDSLR